MTLFEPGPGERAGTTSSRQQAPGQAPGAEAPAGPVRRRVALGLAYDGSGFKGFARQPSERTVGGLLCEALSRLSGEDVPIVCAGRTDAGVHALAQVVHADLAETLLTSRYRASGTDGEELPVLLRALDRQLRPEIRVWRAVLAHRGFDARKSATARRYRYDLDVADRPDPLRRTSAWRVEERVDLAVLRLATDPLLGEHDFAAFCRRPPDRPTGPLTRRVLEARWELAEPGTLRFTIEATAFCHQMVRSVVGVLVASATGRIRPSDVVTLLRSGRRDGAPSPAPACGLSLVAVRYPDSLGGDWF